MPGASEKSDEIYKMKLMLADAWNLQLATDAEKVKEVEALIKGGGSKLHRDAADASSGLHIIEPIRSESSNLNKNTTPAAVDSGIEKRSLEKLIDERIATTLERKRNEEPTNHQVTEKLRD